MERLIVYNADMLKKKLLFLITFLLVLIFPGQVAAESKEFFPSQDTYANLAYPDSINGSHPLITISNKYTTRLGYIQFGDIDLPEGAIVDRGILKFYVYEVRYADFAKFSIGPIDGGWDENTVSWNHKPIANTSLAQNAQISISNVGWKEIELTSIFNKWRDGTLNNFGLYIFPIDYLNTVAEPPFAISLRSENSDENDPRLQVDYHFETTPTPTPTNTPTPSATPTEEPIITDEPVNDESDGVVLSNEESVDTEEGQADTEEKLLTRREITIAIIVFFGLLLLGGTGFALYLKKQKSKTDDKKTI